MDNWRKLTKNLTTYRELRKISRPHGKLAVDYLAAWQFDRSWRMVFWPYGESPGRTKVEASWLRSPVGTELHGSKWKFSRPQNLLSTCVNFPCSREIFRQLPTTFCVNRTAFLNFLYGRDTCQLPSNFHAAKRLAVNFRHLSMQPKVHPSTFFAAGRTYVNFCQIFLLPGDLSTSVNFLCDWQTFRPMLLTFWTAVRSSVNFRQLFVLLGKLPSTSVKFMCGYKTIQQLSLRPGDLQLPPLTLNRAVGWPSVNFRQISLCPGKILSTSVNFPSCRDTFR